MTTEEQQLLEKFLKKNKGKTKEDFYTLRARALQRSTQSTPRRTEAHNGVIMVNVTSDELADEGQNRRNSSIAG